MNRRAALVVAPLVLVGLAAAPSLAAPKQIKKSYTAKADVPDVVAICDGTVPGSIHDEAFTAPAAGKLAVTMKGSDLDWDLYLYTTERDEIDKDFTLGAASALLSHKMTKGEKLLITACNAGAVGTAAMSYTFTYAK